MSCLTNEDFSYFDSKLEPAETLDRGLDLDEGATSVDLAGGAGPHAKLFGYTDEAASESGWDMYVLRSGKVEMLKMSEVDVYYYGETANSFMLRPAYAQRVLGLRVLAEQRLIRYVCLIALTDGSHGVCGLLFLFDNIRGIANYDAVEVSRFFS